MAVKELSRASIARFTHLDYARAMAFAALDRATGDLIGVARLHRMPQWNTAEFAILVRSDLKGHGLGWFLMNILIEYGKRLGLSAIEGDVLPENEMMLKMCAELGFRVCKNPADASLVSVRLQLDKSCTILSKLFRDNRSCGWGDSNEGASTVDLRCNNGVAFVCACSGRHDAERSNNEPDVFGDCELHRASIWPSNYVPSCRIHRCLLGSYWSHFQLFGYVAAHN